MGRIIKIEQLFNHFSFRQINKMEGGCFEDFSEVLNKHRVDLIKKIDFDRQLLLAYLQSKDVLDEEDCQNIIGAGSSRQQKVSKFIDILSRKGRDGYEFFIKALELENGELFELLTGKKPQQSKINFFEM